MNHQLLSYVIYLSITIFITVYVGWLLFKNGWIHLKATFGKEEQLAEKINQLLLVGYYLLNIGYSVQSIHTWPSINNTLQLCTEVGTRSGKIILLLGIMHFVNMWATHYYGKKLIVHQPSPKNILPP